MNRSRKSRVVALEQLEERLVLTLPLGAMPNDTAEFLLGDVLVNVVLMESDGTVDPSTENWTPQSIQTAKQKVEDAMQWWVDTLRNLEGTPQPIHPLNFVFEYQFADNPVATSLEPISRTSNDFSTWINDFFNDPAVLSISPSPTGDFHADIRAFNHAQRLNHGTHWSFTVFVVNDAADADGKFAPGGNFSQAFAFAGGEFFITPAGRPVSTYAHETGHIFYARDEYTGGGSFNDFRGYYNTQNLNALDGNAPGFVQEPSIMAASDALAAAFNTNTSAASSLAMVGWQDSDGDGIFDVLDVEHSLTGTGQFNQQTGEYRFLGSSSVNTLLNLNPAGLQNDITINQIRELQFRIDGGNWVSIDLPDDYSAEIDQTITPGAGFQTLEIRTFDSNTGVASPIFTGLPDRPTSIGPPGISGFVFNDANSNGLFEAGESGLPGYTVQLSSQQALPVRGGIEPDDFVQSQVLVAIDPVATLTIIDTEPTIGEFIWPTAYASAGSPASTGSLGFSYRVGFDTPIRLSEAFGSTIQLRIDFSTAVSAVALDAVGNGGGDFGRLEVFNSAGELLGRYTTQQLEQGDVDTMQLHRTENDIAFAIATGHAGTGVQFDNLRYGPSIAATTDQHGAFSMPFLPAGPHVVEVVATTGDTVTTDASQLALLSGSATVGVDFGVVPGGPLGDQNPNNPFDVTADGAVDVNDILALISDVRINGFHPVSEGSGAAQAPFHDVNGDGQIDVDDIVAVIDFIRFGGSGEAQTAAPSISAATAGGTSSAPASVPSAAGTTAESAEGEPNTSAAAAPQFVFAEARLHTTSDDPAAPAPSTIQFTIRSDLFETDDALANGAVVEDASPLSLQLTQSATGGSLASDLLPQLSGDPSSLVHRLDPQAVDQLVSERDHAGGNKPPSAAGAPSKAEPPSTESDEQDSSPSEDHKRGARARDEAFRELHREAADETSDDDPATDEATPTIDEQLLEQLAADQ